MHEKPRTPDITPSPHRIVRTTEDIEKILPNADNEVIVVNGDTLGLDPAEAATHIRFRTKYAPILYASTSGTIDTEQRQTFYDAGGDAVIDAKDIGPSEYGTHTPTLLQSKIRALYRRHYERQSLSNTAFPEITIEKGVVRIDGKEPDLTRNQFLTFALLLQRAPYAVISAQIIQEALDGNENPNALAAHLFRLRTRLKPYHLDIESLRNKGKHTLFRSNHKKI